MPSFFAFVMAACKASRLHKLQCGGGTSFQLPHADLCWPLGRSKSALNHNQGGLMCTYMIKQMYICMYLFVYTYTYAHLQLRPAVRAFLFRTEISTWPAATWARRFMSNSAVIYYYFRPMTAIVTEKLLMHIRIHTNKHTPGN